MSEACWQSKTLMHDFYSINKKDDYDLYFDDVTPRWLSPKILRASLTPYFAFAYIVRHASVVHLPFSGGALGTTPVWHWEAALLRWADVRVVAMTYGADAYLYSQVQDSSLRNALLVSYPLAGKQESQIAERVKYWTHNADIVLCGFMIDGISRWDVPINNMVSVSMDEWNAKTRYSFNDGTNGIVKILHAPNHRGYKGTEFLIQAIEELKAKNLQIELVLLERVTNEEVKQMMQDVDILVEQLIVTAYGLNAIEGMASGLPVLSNLEQENYTRIFRRYAFLNECPIVSTAPETIARNLEALVRNPELRRQLGEAGREYAEKYHSYETAQYLFGSIYEKILNGKDVDLMNLFHPLKSEYNKRRPFVSHPLKESHLPEEFFERAALMPEKLKL